MTTQAGTPVTAPSRHYHGSLYKGEKVIAILTLLAVAGAVAGGGIYIINSSHAAQKQPVIAHLQQEPPTQTAASTTPRRLLGQLPAQDRCRPPQERLMHHRIRREARQSGRAVWLLVREGDRDAIVSAVARSADQNGGYAARNHGAMTPGNVIAVMAPLKWYREHLDQLRPYAQKPDPAKAGDQVNVGYPAWAESALAGPDRSGSPRTGPCPQLMPATVAVLEKPVGLLTDGETRAAGILAICFAAFFAIGGAVGIAGLRHN